MEFSRDLRSCIVNYHYVEDPRKEFSGIVPCPVGEFEREISFLAGNFAVGSIEDVVKNSQNGEPEKVCAITFDDGLSDQFEFAVPILEKHNAAAIFFITTSTLNGGIPPAHSLHILLSVMSPEKLIEAENEFFKANAPALFPVPLDRRLREGKRMHEGIASANAKEAIAALAPELQAAFLDFCFKRNKIDSGEWRRKLFMTEDQIKDLKSRGFAVGSHFHSHSSLEFADPASAEREVGESVSMLERLLGEKPEIFSYPHGRYNGHVAEVLRKEGARFAVTIERRAVRSGDSPYALPRFDTNDVRDFLNNE